MSFLSVSHSSFSCFIRRPSCIQKVTFPGPVLSRALPAPKSRCMRTPTRAARSLSIWQIQCTPQTGAEGPPHSPVGYTLRTEMCTLHFRRWSVPQDQPFRGARRSQSTRVHSDHPYFFAMCFGLATSKAFLMSILATYIVGLLSLRCQTSFLLFLPLPMFLQQLHHPYFEKLAPDTTDVSYVQLHQFLLLKA